jgi:zinc protease
LVHIGLPACSAEVAWARCIARTTRPSLANRLNTVSYINRTLSWDAEPESIVASLTPAEIKAALVKHIALAKISFVKAGDFAKAAAK